MDQFSFAKRTDWALSQNQITKDLKALKDKGVSILDLTESNPTRCGFVYPPEILTSFNQPKNFQYEPDSQGHRQAREAVAEYYGKKGLAIKASQIVLTSSTSEAYAFLFRLLLNPEESVFVGRPGYPLFDFLAGLNDLEVISYPLIYNEGWSIDIKALEESVQPHTKAIILVNPNNPTGSTVKPQEYQRIKHIAQMHNLAIIADEVFLDYQFSEKNLKEISLAAKKDVLTFVLGGLSKSLGLPQMKLSWIIASGPQALVGQALSRLEVIADTYLSVNTPVQNALGKWLENERAIQGQILDRIRQNYKVIQELCLSSPCELLKGEGGWYAVLRLPAAFSEDQWVLNFLNEDHVFVHPGYFFDFPDEPYIVVSLLPETQALKEGLDRILRRIKAQG